MSFPRYGAYKDSGVEWLGEVPAHWDVVPLKYVVRLRSGGTPSKDRLDYWEGKIPWASAKDMKSERLFDTEDHLSEAAIEDGAAALVEAGAVLVVVRGMILARTFPVALTASTMAINQDLKAILPGERLSGAFVAWFLRGTSDQSLRRLDEAGHGTKALRMDAWTSLEIALPLRDEQNLIVAFLDRETAKIDELVAEQRNLIALLKEKRQALISHAVTKGLDPAAPMKDSGVAWLGELPAHWGVSRIKHIVQAFTQGWSPQCDGYPVESDDEIGVLKVGCVNGGTFKASENKALPADMEPRPGLGLAAGDVLVSRANTRELVGSAAVIDRDFPNLLLCDKLYRVRVNARVFQSTLLAHFLGTLCVRGQIELAATGASSSMLNIGQGTILDLAIPVPPLDEQAAIVSDLAIEAAKIDELVAEAETATAVLQERRTALISAAVTGKIDVRHPALVQKEPSCEMV